MSRLGRWQGVLGLAAFLAAAPAARAEDPHIGYVYPAGGRQGATAEVTVGGQHLAGVSDAYVSGEGVAAEVTGYTKALSLQQLNQLAEKLREVSAFQRQRMAILMPEPGPMQGRGRGKAGAMASTPRVSKADRQKAGTLGLLAAKAADEFEILARQLGLRDASLRGYAALRQRLADPKKQPNAQIAETVTVRLTVAPDAEPGLRELRLRTPAGVTNSVFIQVGVHREYLETEPNDRKADSGVLSGRLLEKERETPESLAVRLDGPEPGDEVEGLDMLLPNMESLPVVLNGQIMPGDIDRFRLRIRKGTRLVAAVSARELVPFLADAVPGWFQATLALYDPKGKELAFADDFRFHPDPVLYYEIPADGEYILEIRDAIYRGREDFTYRVALGEVPFITQAFPLGGPAGVATVADLVGWNLPTRRLALDTTPGDDPIRRAALRTAGRRSNAVPYAVDTLAESTEAEPNDGPATAQRIALPRILNGRIARPGDVDVFRIEGRAGDEIVAEVQARKLHSPLDSLLRLTDASGSVVAWNDDYVVKEGHLHKGMGFLTHHADSYLMARLPKDGAYFVAISDTQDHGGDAYAYRLRISPPQHDVALYVCPSSLNVPAGGLVPLTVHALRQDGFDGEIELALKDAPAGFVLAGARVPCGRGSVRMTLAAPPRGLHRPISVHLEGRARIGGTIVRRPVHPADDTMQAFLWRHLTPSRDLILAVTPARWPAARVALVGDSPVRVPAGAAAQVRLKLPPHPKGQIQLTATEPPKGITLDAVTTLPDGVAFSLKADGDAAKAGLADNLLLEAAVESEVTVTDPVTGKATTQKRQDPLGPLPAIPFVVVQP